MRAVPGFSILGVLDYDVLAFLNGRDFQTPMQVRRFAASDGGRRINFDILGGYRIIHAGTGIPELTIDQ